MTPEKSGVDPVLELRAVHKGYPSPSGGPAIRVLKGVGLMVHPRETLAVVGPSGSGKSTLLALMGGLDVPDSGAVIFSGCTVSSMSERERARMRNRGIGFVFQLHHLLPQCSVWENVLVPTLAFRAGAAVCEEDPASRAHRLIDRVGLTGVSAHRPSQLSGGECLRAALARALINRPAILLADEPTGSLDEGTAGEIMQLLADVNGEEGTSLVVVTHSSILAARMQTRYVLHDGVLRG
jgi:ABC-type lipoprotein export system ATPase subunit